MKKALLIVNPKSGKAKMKTYLMSVVEEISDKGYDVTVYPTKAPEDATKKASTLKNGEYDRIIVAGGDGTLNEVITGLQKAGIDVSIGYIPAGTLNEWSMGLGISRNIVTAASDAAGDNIIKIDIGRFNEKSFSYTASFGAFTEASYSTPQDVKNVLGQAAYFFEGIKSLGNIKPVHLKYEYDDGSGEGDYLFGAVSNSFSVGGIVKFDDTVVNLNDGMFEVILIKSPTNIIQLQDTIDGILKKDFTRENIEFFHNKKITVTGGDGMSWTLDGEYARGEETVVIENVHSALTLSIPKKKITSTKTNKGDII